MSLGLSYRDKEAHKLAREIITAQVVGGTDDLMAVLNDLADRGDPRLRGNVVLALALYVETLHTLILRIADESERLDDGEVLSAVVAARADPQGFLAILFQRVDGLIDHKQAEEE